MHVLVIHCHPEPRSFNGALTSVALETLRGLGHTLEMSDLYGEGFNPVEGPHGYADRADAEVFAPLAEQRHAWKSDNLSADVQREIDRLCRADLVIFQFPLWWHAQPAILKGWFDRVFVSGGLYTSRMRYDLGYFKGRQAICSVTSGAPAETFGPGRRGGDPETLLWPFNYSLHYMGFSVLPPFWSFGIQGHGYAYQGENELSAHLEAQKMSWAQRLQGLGGEESLHFPGWDDWTEDGRPKASAVSG